MRQQTNLVGLLLIFLLVYSGSAQDNTAIGISTGDTWEFEVLQGEFEYTGARDVIVAGEKYIFEVKTDPNDHGNYDYEFIADPISLRKGDLGQFGEHAIYTDWKYWEDNAIRHIENLFSLSADETTNITNDKTIFTIQFKDTLGILDLEFSYYKKTGVAERFYFFINGSGIFLDKTLEIQNNTGSKSSSAPALDFGVFVVLLAILPIVRKLGKR